VGEGTLEHEGKVVEAVLQYQSGIEEGGGGASARMTRWCGTLLLLGIAWVLSSLVQVSALSLRNSIGLALDVDPDAAAAAGESGVEIDDKGKALPTDAEVAEKRDADAKARQDVFDTTSDCITTFFDTLGSPGQFSWNNFARAAVVGGLKAIPEVGPILSSIVGFLWPKSKQPSVWDQVKDQTEQLIEQDIAKDNVKKLISDVEDIRQHYQTFQADYDSYVALATNPVPSYSKDLKRFSAAADAFDRSGETLRRAVARLRLVLYNIANESGKYARVFIRLYSDLALLYVGSLKQLFLHFHHDLDELLSGADRVESELMHLLAHVEQEIIDSITCDSYFDPKDYPKIGARIKDSHGHYYGQWAWCRAQGKGVFRKERKFDGLVYGGDTWDPSAVFKESIEHEINKLYLEVTENITKPGDLKDIANSVIQGPWGWITTPNWQCATYDENVADRKSVV
jgi:hypothetical protein